jgi:putative transposase
MSKAYEVQKIEIKLNEEDRLSLDRTSKTLCKLNNSLIDSLEKDFLKSGDIRRIQDYYTVLNRVDDFKRKYSEFDDLYYLLSKSVGFRVLDSVKKLPYGTRAININHKDWESDWYSLFYSKKGTGFSVKNRVITFQISKNESIQAILTEKIGHYDIINMRIDKQHYRYFAIFCHKVEIPKTILPNQVKRWIAIDQNHENFFTGIDNRGITYRFEKLKSETYFNQTIDDIVDKIKACTNPYRKDRLYKALNRVTNKRAEQTFSALHSISKVIATNFDAVLIGNYVPCRDDLPYENLKKIMVDRTHIARFRSILEWDMKKRGKIFVLVDEKNTTSSCCICGNKEHKDTSIREFTCKKTGTKVIRDLNSCVNIARKGGAPVAQPIPVVTKINQVYIYDYRISKVRRVT